MNAFSERIIDFALDVEDGAPLIVDNDLAAAVSAEAKSRDLSPVVTAVLDDPTSPEVVRLRAMVILATKIEFAA